MKLTESQQNSVRQWAAAGASLAEIQNRLTEEFSIRMSFMEVRLLVLDLDVTLRDKRPQEPAKPEADSVLSEPEDPSFGDGTESPDDTVPPEQPGDVPEGTPGVRVEISRLAQPGFVLNGEVSFSDGVRAQWGITSRGELSLTASDTEYRPSPDDVQAFQAQLRTLISQQGY